MNFDEYQLETIKTEALSNLALIEGVSRCALGLCGEAGEFADLVKKMFYERKIPVDPDALADELGDVLWYVATMCNVLGIEMGAVAQCNLYKLGRRYSEGVQAVHPELHDG